jgi:hypothetical protein
MAPGADFRVSSGRIHAEDAMPAFSARHALTRSDAEFVVRCLTRSGSDAAEVEARLRDEGIDSLLDEPRLLGVILDTPQGAHASLPLFTYLVVRSALRRAGEEDRALADMVAGTVLEFAIRDRACRVSEVDDETYVALTDLLRDLDTADVRRNFLVRLHLGNYALWLSGLFPDYIEHRRWRRGGPNLEYYEELGSRGYRMASSHRIAEEHGLSALLTRAADRFGTLRLALNAVSDRLLFPGLQSPERLMRQVRGETLRAWGMVN